MKKKNKFKISKKKGKGKVKKYISQKIQLFFTLINFKDENIARKINGRFVKLIYDLSFINSLDERYN